MNTDTLIIDIQGTARDATKEIDNLVKSFRSFQHILAADLPALDEVEGIGEVRARNIKQSLHRMQEQFVFDNVML